MSLQFDTTTNQAAIKAATVYRLSYPNPDKNVLPLQPNDTISFTINGKTINRTVPAGVQGYLRIIYEEK